MKRESFNFPEPDQDKTSKRQKIANFAGSISLGAGAYFTFKHYQAMEQLTYAKELWAVLSVLTTSGSIGLMMKSALECNNGDEDGGTRNNEIEPSLPPDRPGGIRFDLSDLTTDQILGKDYINESDNKLLVKT